MRGAWQWGVFAQRLVYLRPENLRSESERSVPTRALIGASSKTKHFLGDDGPGTPDIGHVAVFGLKRSCIFFDHLPFLLFDNPAIFTDTLQYMHFPKPRTHRPL